MPTAIQRGFALAASLIALAAVSLPGCAKRCEPYTFARDLIQNAGTPAEFLSALNRYCGTSQTPGTGGQAIIKGPDGRNLCSLSDREKQQALSRSHELVLTVEGAWPPFTPSASKRGTGAQLMQRRGVLVLDDPRRPTFVQIRIYPDSPYALYLVQAGSAPSESSLLERFASFEYQEGHVRVHLTIPRFSSSTQWQYRSDSVGWTGRIRAGLTVDRYGIDRTEIYRGPRVKHLEGSWNGQDVTMSIRPGASWYLIRDGDRLVMMSGRI
jgi:hypothetical protein